MGEVHAESLYCCPAIGTLHGLPYPQQRWLAGSFTYVITAAQASVVCLGGGQAAPAGDGDEDVAAAGVVAVDRGGVASTDGSC